MSSSPSSLSSNDRPAGMHLGRLQDVICRVDVVLGTGTIAVRECLALRRDGIIRLDQEAGAELQVLVNGVAVAVGEVVIVDDSTAVRLTDILAPSSAGGDR